MFEILKKTYIAPDTIQMSIMAPRVAASAQPGQFVIIIADEYSERIPLTICDYDTKKGTVDIVIKVAGSSTQKICNLNEGEYFRDFVGPLGNPSDLVHEDPEALKKKKVLFVGGGAGIAPIYCQVKWCHENGLDADVLIAAKTEEFLILTEELKATCGNLYIATDDGSVGFKGLVTEKLAKLIEEEHKEYDLIVAIGPMIMMKFVCELTKEYKIPTTVSLNPIMVDGTGMCGACRCNVGGKTKFACVDGPEFDGHLVDFDNAIVRQRQYKDARNKKFSLDNKPDITKEIKEEKKNIKLEEELSQAEAQDSSKKSDRFIKIPVKNQDPDVRINNFNEVCLGYTKGEAVKEAKRCLNCKKPLCVGGCPVAIDIPGFIKEIANENFEQAFKVLSNYTALPAVCGRVCPQETQCEERCILGKRGDAVSIGKLERFVADYARENELQKINKPAQNSHKVAVVGAGPAGLTCAGELAKSGYDVNIFEVLHVPGGVLVYGIPEFRLPDEIVAHEVKGLLDLGVKINTDVLVGRTVTVDQLLQEGYEAVFIGSGAGLPKFMNIPGEDLNGVSSANEFLTRVNLMRSVVEGYETPVKIGDKVAVVGGGNVAMDAARVARRLGSEVTILYRRTDAELPARREEIEHAKEEGIRFEMLTAPVEIIGDESGNVKSVKCIRNELGEPDDSGRRRPVKIEGSEFEEEFQTVIMALGTSPNPLISRTTKGLDITNWGGIIIDDRGQTSREEIYAGGDAVTGSATVILAMGAGKTAAEKIHEYISNKNN
ncbi:bifunctional dihydroorotate dehydrogenase B NAD binding subunit/NADPH-dependent glutamate synthase [Peptoniphilus catoniae]|uniref:bifunctional dihydroorotate dehydrogenase B NAD binding subunit/NADPH-dependent glutamate synthase n=1 Tax=Peptoniphilus catoniae TaxID=1660341 RepID=UPI0010FDC9BF|nr:bifunctional dihydroorotate dehydrogenase B NAD binding subunit/NADPH-dependent glutamate synthase [Peptoniphilus catoniae]